MNCIWIQIFPDFNTLKEFDNLTMEIRYFLFTFLKTVIENKILKYKEHNFDVLGLSI